MKRALLFAAIIVVLGGLAVLVRFFGNDASTGPTVAYSSVGDANAWFLTFAAALETEAEKRGYRLRVTHAQGEIDRQIADVEDLVADKPEFLILGPITPDDSVEALRIAKKAGVPVVVVNRDIEGVAGEDFITKIYSDFDWIGERMAELVHDAFGADAEVIRVVELHGTQGSANTDGMSRGFRKKMKEYPNMRIVVSQPGNFNKDTAMKAMESIIQSGVEFDAVVGHFDTDALGAIRALRAANRKPGSNPQNGESVIVGNGGTKDGMKAIEDGSYHKMVSVTPYYADVVFDAIEAYKKDEALPDYIRVEDTVIDKSNVDKHMPTAF